MLKESSNSMQKFSVLKILSALPSSDLLPKYLNSEPDRVNFLLDTLKEPSDFLRNGKSYSESILLMKKIATNNSEISKLLAFQGIFEILTEIMTTEDSVIVKDCTELMKILMTDFNKNYIRELPCVYKTVSELLKSDYKETILEFILTVCTTDTNNPHTLNQQYFSRLVPQIITISYPNSGQQTLTGLKILRIFLKFSSQSIHSLLEAENVDTLDNILSYCALGANHQLNIEIL